MLYLRALCDKLELAAVIKVALSRRKQGFESPRERQQFQRLKLTGSVGVQPMSNKRMRTQMDGWTFSQDAAQEHNLGQGWGRGFESLRPLQKFLKLHNAMPAGRAGRFRTYLRGSRGEANGGKCTLFVATLHRPMGQNGDMRDCRGSQKLKLHIQARQRIAVRI